MKQNQKRLAIVIALAGGLAAASSASAQIVTTISDFNNITLTHLYANWANPALTTIISSPTGYEVRSSGYGSGVYDFATPINAAGATEVRLTLTINSPTSGPTWMGPTFDLSDGTHQVTYFQYANYTGPGTYVLTAPVGSLDVSTVTAFNIEFDPAGYGSGPYDITYHNLSLIAVPEPGTLALLAVGLATLVIKRRRVR